MTFISNVNAAYRDSANIDAFARLRVSNPHTIFDSKQLYDNNPLFWDDSEVSGGSTTSIHSSDTASSVLSVANAVAGKRVRQTFMSFNYQPGKSQLIFMTGTLNDLGGGTGIKRAFGQFNDDNGIFLQDNEGVYEMVIRSSATGSAVENNIIQSSWNLDVMDGTGPSGVTLDFTKSQILIIDYEWLGVGRVRTGFVIDGIPIYVHEFLHANNLAGVYMSTPNLPLRYEIENTGTGVASDLEHICASVISEGGVEELGTLRYKSTEGTHLDANTADIVYALIGIRLKSAYIGSVIKELSASFVASTTDSFEWILIKNPTVAGTFTYSDVTNSALQTAIGTTANTVTNGVQIAGGFGHEQTSIITSLNNASYLGADIAGTVDELVLCIRPLSVNLDIDGGLTWRELR